MRLGRVIACCVLSTLTLVAGIAGAGGPNPPQFSKVFGATDIFLNDSTTLSFSLTNNNATALTNIGFTDVLPAGLVVATPNGLNGGCGNGIVVAVAGSNTIKLTGGNLLADISCSFRVNVTGVALGTQNNVSGQVTTAETLPGGTAKASVNVNVPPPPLLSSAKSFSPASIALGGTSTLTITLHNNDDEFSADGIDLSDTFPTGMTLVPGAQSNTCGGVFGTTANGLTLTGGTLSSGATCQVAVLVTAGTPGTLTNTTSAIRCVSQFTCSGNPASAVLNVTGVTPPNVAPVITSAPPPPGTVGVPYSYPITATGSPTPTISASGLPPGLFYSQPGNLIFGTPTLEGSFATTVIAVNGVQPDDVRNYTIPIVNPLGVTIPEGGTQLPGGTTGKPYGPVIFTGTGGKPPYTFTACGLPLPPGLTLATNGALSGTPTQAGSYTFDVCIEDTGGTKKAQPFTVVVGAVTSAMTMTVAPNPAASGLPVAVTVQVTGAATVATGLVQFWVAGAGTKCPAPFVAGLPNDPVVAVRTATLDATGRARLTYASLRIDDYFVCATYAGDGLYSPANAGPVSLAVIKGFLLPPPAVTMSVPASVTPSAVVAARIAVAGADGSPVPQGSVRVRVAENEIATAPLTNGSAVISMRMPVSGVVTLTADYMGDDKYPPASSGDAVVAVAQGFAAVAAGEIIPTLSEYAVAALALLLGLLGVRRARGR
jgi:uncharacterized repeat protein (TIGR01451 family)